MKLLSLFAAVALVSTAVDAKTFLFPAPQDVTWSGTSVGLASHFQITGIQNQNVKAAADRYLALIKKERWVPVSVPANATPVKALSSQLTGMKVQVSDNHVKLDIGVDESYSLVVPPKGGVATLKAKTWVGALRAMETFSQLVEADKHNKLVVHTASITDAPTYGHRGILLDCARNYYPVNSILRILDAMAYQKMNVFHWHATDSQSWPLYFKNHPEISGKGAYSPKETYTPNQVKHIISYAESLGIRVLIEIDSPAHTASIGQSHPDLVLCADEFWAAYASEPPAGQINPINPKAVSLVNDLLLESASRFPDSLLHTGGDEINTACWELYPAIKDYMKKKGFASTKEIWFEYTNNLLNFVNKKTNKRPIIWEDGNHIKNRN
jgi:hexosaminidase